MLKMIKRGPPPLFECRISAPLQIAVRSFGLLLATTLSYRSSQLAYSQILAKRKKKKINNYSCAFRSSPANHTHLTCKNPISLAPGGMSHISLSPTIPHPIMHPNVGFDLSDHPVLTSPSHRSLPIATLLFSLILP